MTFTPAETLFLVGWLCAVILGLFTIATLVGLALLHFLPGLIPVWAARILADEGFDRRRTRRPLPPLFEDCRECLLARDAGDTVQWRHAALDHGYLVLGDPRLAA